MDFLAFYGFPCRFHHRVLLAFKWVSIRRSLFEAGFNSSASMAVWGSEGDPTSSHRRGWELRSPEKDIHEGNPRVPREVDGGKGEAIGPQVGITSIVVGLSLNDGDIVLV